MREEKRAVCFEKLFENWRDTNKTITLLTVGTTPIRGLIMALEQDYIEMRVINENIWSSIFVPFIAIIGVEISYNLNEGKESNENS